MNMFMRRMLAAATMALAIASPALADDWRKQYPALSFGISSSENETDAMARTKPFSDYLTKELGVPVTITRGTDYAAVIEAMHSGHVQFASVGPAAYALGRKIMGDGIAPVAVTLDPQGHKGYYSVVEVKADSPYKTLADLKGKSFAWADPNSASGYQVPSYYLSKMFGMPADQYFSPVAFSGGHEQSVIGLINGTFEGVATNGTPETPGNVQNMERKGMIPKGSLRTLWTSPLIPGTPVMMLTSLPKELQDAFKQALFDFPTKDPKGFATYSRGTSTGFAPAQHEDYVDLIAITEFNDAARKRAAN
jgi:phosphonate transport system substrate-binding protein